MSKELSTSIDGTEPYQRVMVDEFGGDGVWLSMNVRGGNCHMVVSFDAAREMIKALQQVIDAQEKVEESTT